MARGWESKSVESQQADARQVHAGPVLTPEARVRLEKRQALDGWARELARIVAGEKKASAKVHRLRRA